MKNKKGVIIFLIALILVSAAGAVYIFKSEILKRLSPEKYMQSVFLNTVRSLERDILKLPDHTAPECNPYEFFLSLGLKDYKIKSIPEEFEYTMEALKLISFNLNSRVDRNARKNENELKVLAGGIDMADFSLFLSDETYAVACGLLTDKTVTINPKTFVSDWNASQTLVPLTNITMPDIINVDGLNDFIFSDKSIIKNSDEELLKELKNESVEFILSADVKYIGKDGGYDIVEARYGKDAVNKLYKLFTKYLMDSVDERFSSYLKFASDYPEVYIPLKLIESYKNSISSVSFEDGLTFNLYIDEKNVIKRIEAPDTKISIDSKNVNAKITIELYGQEYLSDNLVFLLALNPGSSLETTIKAVNTLEGSTVSTLQHNLSIDINDAGLSSSHKYSAEWDKEDSGDFELSYYYESAENKAGFSLEGRLSDEDDKVSLKNGLLKASVNDESIELKTGYTIKKYDSSVEFNNENAFPFFDINVFELNSIFMRAQNFLYSF